MKKEEKKGGMIASTLIAGLTATILGFTTYVIMKKDGHTRGSSGMNKKKERLFI